MQPNEREQAIVSFVFGFAVGEAGQPAEASPVGCAWIGAVSGGQSLGSEGAEELGKNPGVFEPGLEVASPLVSTTAQGSKPSAERLASLVWSRSSSTV